MRKSKAKRAKTYSAKPQIEVEASWDIGAIGPANRERLVKEPAVDTDPQTGKATPNPNGITRYRRRAWVETYRITGVITDQQYSAALRLYHLYHGRGQQDPLAAITARVDQQTTHDQLAAAFDAKRQFFTVWAKIPNHCRDVVRHVVIEDMPVSKIGKYQNSRIDAANKQALRNGLDAV